MVLFSVGVSGPIFSRRQQSTVNRVIVERFKNIKFLQLDLAPVNILAGTNNSGKSAVLQAIQFGISAAQGIGGTRHLVRPKGKDSSATLPPSDLFYSPVEEHEVMTLAHGSPLTQKTESAIEVGIEVGDPGSLVQTRLKVSKGRNGNLKVAVDSTELWNELSSLSAPFSMYVPGLSGIAPSEAYMTPAGVRRAAARGHGNVVLRNVLWQLRSDDQRWARFGSGLTELFPGHRIEISHDPQRSELIDVSVRVGKYRHPLGLAGTGLLQAIQILAYMNLYGPKLLLLDEPDSHLHPDKQVRLLAFVSEWADRESVRVIIATHSRHLIRAPGTAAQLFWMHAGDARPVAEREAFALLAELGALDVGDRLRGGSIDVLVVTEDAVGSGGKSPALLQALLAANGVDLERVDFVSYEGAGNVGAATSLARLSLDIAPGTKVVVYRDRDYLSEADVEVWKAQVEASGAHPLVSVGTDLESYFLRPTHVAQAIGLATSEAEALLQEARTRARPATELKLADRVQSELVRSNREAGRTYVTPNPAKVMTEVAARIDADPRGTASGKASIGHLKQLLHEQGHDPKLLLVPTAGLVDSAIAIAMTVEVALAEARVSATTGDGGEVPGTQVQGFAP